MEEAWFPDSLPSTFLTTKAFLLLPIQDMFLGEPDNSQLTSFGQLQTLSILSKPKAQAYSAQVHRREQSIRIRQHSPWDSSMAAQMDPKIKSPKLVCKLELFEEFTK